MSRESAARWIGLVALGVLFGSPAGAANFALDFQQLNDPYIKDHLQLRQHPSIGEEFTVEFWIRPDDSIPFCATEADPQGCWSTGDTWYYGNFIFDGHQNFEQNPGRDSFDVVLANSGRIKVVLDPGTTETDGATDLVTGGTWRHVAVVREWFAVGDHRVRIFVDGQLDGEVVYGGRAPLLPIFPHWGTERADWAGAVPDDFPDYFGLVDEIRYWDVARTQSQIQQTMNVELTGTEPGLVHYLRLNEGQGALAHDMVGNNDGIIFNLQPNTWIPSTAPITVQPGPDCGDGIQNQGEAGIDCGGPCPPCPPATESDCGDGADNDLDGLTDCVDPDCALNALCNGFPVEGADRDADHNPIEGVMLGNFFNPQQICIGDDGSRQWQMGLQFRVTVPVPITVTAASIELSSSGDNAGGFTTTIRSVLQDQIAPFVAGTQPSFTATYPLSQAAVPWAPPAVAAGAAVTTPEMRELIQEIVDRPQWQSGNFIGIVMTEATQPGNWRCYSNFTGGGNDQAILRVDYYTHGTPVCVDVRSGGDRLDLFREPPSGCPQQPGGTSREFVFGEVAQLVSSAGTIDLGPLRCAGEVFTTTDEVVRSRDPDLPTGEPRFYLWRAVGDPDFGTGQLPDGSEPRISTGAACP